MKSELDGSQIFIFPTTTFTKSRGNWHWPLTSRLNGPRSYFGPNKSSAQFYRLQSTLYLSEGLFVIVSWISFLIPMDVIPGRMALLVTLFLVLVNIFNNVTTNTPKAEGLTAIEAWMLACILFVFGALVEWVLFIFFANSTDACYCISFVILPMQHSAIQNTFFTE